GKFVDVTDTESVIGSPQDGIRAIDNILDYISTNRLVEQATPELRSQLVAMQSQLLASAQAGMGEAGSLLNRAHTALNAWRPAENLNLARFGRDVAKDGTIQFHIDHARVGDALTERAGERVRDETISGLEDVVRQAYNLVDTAESFGFQGAEALRQQLDNTTARIARDAAWTR